MPRDYNLYLEDIMAAIERIEIYTRGISFQQFHENTMIIDAVLHNLEIIGEVAKSLPEEVKSRFSEVEWRKISGLRDIIVHQYFGISLEIVWDILQNKLPGLRFSVAEILKGGFD
jgi:uncharacterized protein with HEPN domain